MAEYLGQQWIFFLILGLTAGILSGMLGIGSGIIVVPAMVILLGAHQKEAQGTALTLMIFLAVTGSLRYHLNQDIHLNFKAILIMAITAILGSIIGSHFAFLIPAQVLKKIFGLFIILAGIKMLWPTKALEVEN